MFYGRVTMNMDGRRVAQVSSLHFVAAGGAMVWWLFVAGEQFSTRATTVAVATFVGWLAVAGVWARRRHKSVLSAAALLLAGWALPLAWIAGAVVSGVALAFAVTTGLVGFAFLGIIPLALWGAFVATHLTSRWIVEKLWYS